VKPTEAFDWKILFEKTVNNLKKTNHPLEKISRNKKEESIRDLLVGHMLTTTGPQVILSESHYAQISVSNDSSPDIGDDTRCDIMHFGEEFTSDSISNPKLYLELKVAYNGDYKPAPGRNLQTPWAELRSQKDTFAFFNDTRRLLEFKENHPDTVCLQGLLIFYNVNAIYKDRRDTKYQDPKLLSDAFAEMFKRDGLRQVWLSNALAKLKKNERKIKSEGKKPSKTSKDLKYSLMKLHNASPQVKASANFLLTEEKYEKKYWIRLYLFELAA
jgi:hypothetical protein